MVHKFVDERFTPEEWETAHRIVDIVRKNDLGAHILIYFEHDFSAVNKVDPSGELVIVPPLDIAAVLGLAKKNLIDIDFRHGNEVFIISLRKNLFAAVDAGLERGIDSLP